MWEGDGKVKKIDKVKDRNGKQTRERQCLKLDERKKKRDTGSRKTQYVRRQQRRGQVIG